MLRKFPKLFAKDYTNIRGVDAFQHKIELKPEATPKAQKATMAWIHQGASSTQRGEEAFNSRIHLSGGKFRVGISSCCHSQKEWKMEGMC